MDAKRSIKVKIRRNKIAEDSNMVPESTMMSSVPSDL